MRLIEADKLKDTECRLCAFCLEDSKGHKDIDGCREMGCGVMDMIDSQPTVDAIPVEQVARMFARFTEDYPCNFAHGYYQSQKDEFCGFDGECPTENNYDCWIHAIKEGWLDDDNS